MPGHAGPMIQRDLFACGADPCGSDGGGPAVVPLGAGAAVLRGFALSRADALIHAIGTVAESAPFRHLETRGGGQMSAAMTNCGTAGWVSDRRGGTRRGAQACAGVSWRCRGMGWPVAHGVPRRGPDQRSLAPRHRRAAVQPDLSHNCEGLMCICIIRQFACECTGGCSAPLPSGVGSFRYSFGSKLKNQRERHAS